MTHPVPSPWTCLPGGPLLQTLSLSHTVALGSGEKQQRFNFLPCCAQREPWGKSSRSTQPKLCFPRTILPAPSAPGEGLLRRPPRPRALARQVPDGPRLPRLAPLPVSAAHGGRARGDQTKARAVGPRAADVLQPRGRRSRCNFDHGRRRGASIAEPAEPRRRVGRGLPSPRRARRAPQLTRGARARATRRPGPQAHIVRGAASRRTRPLPAPAPGPPAAAAKLSPQRGVAAASAASARQAGARRVAPRVPPSAPPRAADLVGLRFIVVVLGAHGHGHGSWWAQTRER